MDFQIAFLDHVAIRVKDLEAAAKWYEKVLGLKKYQIKEWGDFPIFLLAGKTGIALFPAKVVDEKTLYKTIGVDHFAFNVTRENFRKAKIKFDSLGIVYKFQDHHFFHSIYIEDPDGHIVELTTLAVPENTFYT